MKLNKRICKKCWCTRFDKRGWGKIGEDNWKRGLVLCILPGCHTVNTTSTDKLPENCPYRLEHLVSQ